VPKYIPYRGDGFPKDFEPRKRFVNLRKLRWSLIKTISVIVAIFGRITFFFLRTSSHSGIADKTSLIVALVLLWIFPLVIIAGILELNRFRKGRDVDISEREEEIDRQEENNKET
jgi:hypothetical protein